MNKIKELAEKAGFIFYDLHDIDGEDWGETIEANDWKVVDKFCNLILQEYTTVIDKLIMDEYIHVNSISGASTSQLVDIEQRVDPAFLPIMNVLKKRLQNHFGVEK